MRELNSNEAYFVGGAYRGEAAAAPSIFLVAFQQGAGWAAGAATVYYGVPYVADKAYNIAAYVCNGVASLGRRIYNGVAE